MILALRRSLAALAVPAGACSPPDLAELVQVDVTSASAVVDTSCGAECAPVYVTADVSLDTHYSVPADGEIEVLQYRVDAAIPGTTATPPFFAAETSATVAVGETAALVFQVAGTAQVAWIDEHFGGDEIGAEAKLTIAGRGPDDRVFEVSDGFAVTYGDYGTGSTDTGM